MSEEKKNNLGRKRKGDDSERKHNSSSPDNVFKKFKTNLINFLLVLINDLLNKIGTEEKLLKIRPEYYTNGKIEKNKELFKEKLSTIFSKERSKKYLKEENKNNNINIINEYKDNLNLKKIFDMTLEESIKIFMKSKEEYKKEYSENKFLFQNLNSKDQNEIDTIILNGGVFEFLNNKTPRNKKKEKSEKNESNENQNNNNNCSTASSNQNNDDNSNLSCKDNFLKEESFDSGFKDSCSFDEEKILNSSIMSVKLPKED